MNNYATLADVIAYLPNNEAAQTPGSWDVQIGTILNGVSRQVDTFTLRPFGTYAASDVVSNLYDGVLPSATDFQYTIFTDEMATTPTLVEIAPDGFTFQTLNTSNYYLWPSNALYLSLPYSRIYLNPRVGPVQRWPQWVNSVRVTAIFGYSQSVPPDIHQCVLDMTSRILRRIQQRFVDTGVMMDVAQLLAGSKLEKDIQDTLAYYRRSGLTRVRR